MNPGIMRDRFIMQVNTGSQEDRLGAITPAWETDFEDWCAFETLGTREFPTIEKRNSETTARFRIRHRSDVANNPNKFAADHRILFTSEPDASPTTNRIFNIFPPFPDPTKAYKTELIIEARERQTEEEE